MSNFVCQEKQPAISVIIPVHNANKYLRPCLDSILAQTYSNFELIAIDDHSTDDSYTILKEYGNRDDRIRILYNEKSLGAALTRNRGLYEARGTYIIFLDADDYFELNYFEKMFLSIETNKTDIVICSVLWRDESLGTESIQLKVPIELQDKFARAFSPSDFQFGIFYYTEIMPFNKLIRREFLLEKKIEFQDISNCNDMYFGFMVLAEAKSIFYLNGPFIHYRYNTGSQISTNRYKNPLCVCYALKKIREELINRRIWNKFSRLYNDMAIASVFLVVKRSNELDKILEYVHSFEDSNLAFFNLRYNDFLSPSAYIKYRIIFYGKRAILGNIWDMFVFLIKDLMHGDYSILYCMIEHYFRKILIKSKR